MDHHKYSNSKSPPTTGTSSPYESEPQELKNGGTADVHMRRKKGRIYPDAPATKNFQRYASPQPILGMPNTSIAGVVSNELSAITASPIPLESDSDAIYNISPDEELPPPPVELLDNTDDYPRIRFSYGSTDSEQNLHFDDFPPERETRNNNLRVRRNDTGSSQSPPTSSLTEKSPSPPSSKSGSKHLRPVPPSDSEEDRRPQQEDIKFRSIDFSKYKNAFRRGDSSTDADVCSDGDVHADIHTPLLQEGGGSPVREKSASPKKDSPAGLPLLDGRESQDSKQRRSSSNGSRRGSQNSQRSRKNGKRNGKDPRGSSKSVKSASTFEPIEQEDPWSLRTDIPPPREPRKPPPAQIQQATRDQNGRPPIMQQQARHNSGDNGRDRRSNGQKLDPRDRYADARDSSLSTDSSMMRYPLSRQYGIESHSPASSVQRHEFKPTMGTQVLKKDDKDRPLPTPQGYPLAQFPPGHFPPPPMVPRPRDLPRPPQVRDFQTNTGEHTPDPLTTPESALGYRPHYARSQPRCIDRTGRGSPPMKSSVSAGDILFSDAVIPGSLSAGDLRGPRQPRQMSHVRSVPRDLYAVPNKMGTSQSNRSWHQSQYSVDRVEVDTLPPPPSRKPSVRKNDKKRRFKHLRDRHYPICIAVSFATMLCINPPIGFIAVVFSYLSWKAYDRGDERTGFILARSALYTSLAGIIFTMTVIITTLYQTTIGF